MIKIQAKAAGAEVLIYDPIGADWLGNGVTAKRFRDDLERLGDVSDITVRINSPGGEVFDGFAIYNALKDHPAQVHVHIDGLAASIASVIAMAGDLVTMGEGAMLMIHDPWTMALGDSDAMRQTADMLDKVKVGLVDAYARRTGLERDAIDALMKAETWLTADEAIAQGFADERATSPKEPKPKAAAWQSVMAQFRNTPESLKQPAQASPLSASADATPTESTMSNPSPSALTQADIDTARREAVAAEAKRRADIVAVFAMFPGNDTLRDACAADLNCTEADARAKLLAALAKDVTPSTPHIAAGQDSRDKFVAGVVNSIFARHGKEKLEAGNNFAGISLQGIARECLARAGVSGAHRLEGSALSSKIFAAHSTSDFPLILANTANKAMRAAYDAAPHTWQRWCDVGSVPDFKSNSRLQIGTFNSLAEIKEGGEYTYGSMAEEGETISAKTKGKGLKVTRQLLINDDLGQFVKAARLMGIAAARTVNEDVYALLVSASGAGPTMSDTGALFNATAVTTAGGHANLTSSGTAISVASLNVGRSAMALQKDKSLRTVLNLRPKYLLVPVGKEQLAYEVLNSSADPASSNSAKANFARTMNLEVVADANLDAASATAWYLFADQNIAPVIEVAFLDGNQTPFVDDEVDFETDSMKWKVRLDYGVGAIDWRGAYRNAGA